MESGVCGFKILDKMIREERIEERRPRAEPQDTPIKCRVGRSNKGVTTPKSQIKLSTTLQE